MENELKYDLQKLNPQDLQRISGLAPASIAKLSKGDTVT